MTERSTSRSARRIRYSVRGVTPLRHGTVGTSTAADAMVTLCPDAPTGRVVISTPTPRGVELSAQGVVQLIRAEGLALRVLTGRSAPGSGEVSATPPPGQPPPAWGNTAIIPAVLHDAWCAWPWRVSDPRRPELASCAGCGLYVEADLDAGGGQG